MNKPNIVVALKKRGRGWEMMSVGWGGGVIKINVGLALSLRSKKDKAKCW